MADEEDTPVKRPVGIQHFEFGERLIESKRGSFNVRGMNTDDLTFLVSNYLEDMVNALIQFGEKQGDDVSRFVDRAAWPELLLVLTQDFPELVTEIISRCAEAPEHIAMFRKLAFPVQLQALHAIVELTTEDAGGLGNLWAALRILLETRGLRLGPLAKNLQSITGALGKASPFVFHRDTDDQNDIL